MLDERKLEVLRAIVPDYVSSQEPVGSKALVEKHDLGVSPATVRNDMGALEDAGYIYQPHTSAGRVPTDAGYRYFVDAWATGVKLPSGDAARIRTFFGQPRWELEDGLRRTAALLSSLTDHAAVVFAPALDRSFVRHVELVRLSGDRAMIILVTDTGRVENHVALIPESLDDVQLDHAADMLNRVVVDTPLERAAVAITTALDRFPLELRDAVAALADALDEAIARHAEGWSVERIAPLERNIMRVALYEASHSDDVPMEVAVDEAVSLAREYSGADAPGFVNGVLGAAVRATAGDGP